MGCNYSVMNNKTRLAQVYKRLGVNRLTPEAKELLRPRNCPFFEAGRRRRLQQTPITLDGSRPWKAHRHLSFDEDAARAMYEQGANDREIAETVGTSSGVICQWRQRRGLPSPYWKNHGKL